MGPTLAGFSSFIYTVMGVPVAALPTNSPYITDAYNYAIEVVLDVIAQVSTITYTAAVYNLAADYLINWATDVSGSTYFATQRKTFNINNFVPGVIQSSADVSTSESLLVPDAMKGLTMGDLQRLKTPYGRQYLAIAQKFGANWGLS